jgi:hypothetical protein
MWRLKFWRLVSRIASRGIDRAEQKAISAAREKYGYGNPPGMRCGCGDCWLYWLQNK